MGKFLGCKCGNSLVKRRKFGKLQWYCENCKKFVEYKDLIVCEV